MARGRLISKSLSTSQRFASLSGSLAEFCQALYPLIVAHADDFGRLAGDEFTVKHLVFPTSPRKLADFTKALWALHEAGLVQWYTVDGRKCLQVTNFDTHQPGLHRRTRSEFPEFQGSSGKVPEIPSEQNRTELNGREQNRTADAKPSAVESGDGFSEFWLAYPRKDSRKDAEKAWSALKPTVEIRSAILEDVQRRIRSEPWLKDGGKFVPYGATYLRGRRWEDEATTIEPTVTDRERRQAEEVRRKAFGRCPHDPPCGSYSACVTAIALEQRLEKVRA